MINQHRMPLIFYAVMAIVMSATPVRVNAASDELPSMELLEFLGEWQTEEGDWVDPERFLTISENELDSEQLKKASANDYMRTNDNVKEEHSDD